MASITINTTAAQDNAAQRFVADYNREQKALNPNWQDVTPVQYLRAYVTDRLNALVTLYTSRDDVSRSELFNRASDADKQTIVGILDKYR